MNDGETKYLHLIWIPALWVLLSSFRVFQGGAEPLFNKKLPSKGKSLLVIGDSHTKPSGGWAESLRSSGEFGAFAKIAENGKTTAWMLAQLKSYLQNNKAPDYIVVWGGANDAYNNTASKTTLSNMQTMIDTAKAKGSKIVFVSGYDPQKVSYNFNTKGLIGTETTLGQGRDRFIALLDSMPSKLKGYTLIVPKHPNYTRSNSTDGLHLTPATYRSYGEWVATKFFGG